MHKLWPIWVLALLVWCAPAKTLAAPQSGITIPSGGMPLGGLANISGTAQETNPVTFKNKKKKRSITTSVSFVEVSIQNSADGTYWNGAGWTKAEKWLIAQGGANWTLNCSRVAWTMGKTYMIRSKAVNTRKQVEKPPQSVTVSIPAATP